ncbi:hypothetical protein RUM43_000791 [Polyplax serrata]|uniref:Transcription initiation factor TFIID subunit 9 n=1 Tax=Polyplax serrata TaxID=468196 RepID=A0AAN8SEE5_POLSC
MSSSNPLQTKHVPKDAQVIMSILKDMGVVDFEPQTIVQLLEFTYRYVTSTLEDARVYATHANKKVIDIEDVQLAVHMQLDKNFTTPPPRDMLLEVARNKNSVPLPQIRPHCGIRLPPDRYCMTACNYELKSNKKPPAMTKQTSVFGASQSSVFKSQIKPTLKRSIQTIARTQTVTIPKPVIKFTPTTTSGEASSQPQIQVQQSLPQQVNQPQQQQQWKHIVQQPVIQTIMEVDESPASVLKSE